MTTSDIKVAWKTVAETDRQTVNRSGRAHGKSSLFMYFDESGDFGFGQDGSRFFIITCLVTERPFVAADIVRDYRINLLEDGLDLERFHACEDNREARLGVYKRLAHMDDRSLRVYSVAVEKACIPPDQREGSLIYSKLFAELVDEVYKSEHLEDVATVVAITDRLPVESKRTELKKPLKRYMKERFQDNGIPYRIYHHNSCSDTNLQIADYFCWAIHRQMVCGKDWPMSMTTNVYREIGTVTYEQK